MKKLFVAGLLFLGALFMSSCGTSHASNESVEPTTIPVDSAVVILSPVDSVICADTATFDTILLK